MCVGIARDIWWHVDAIANADRQDAIQLHHLKICDTALSILNYHKIVELQILLNIQFYECRNFRKLSWRLFTNLLMKM